ncbi:MAG: diheme cytochrome c [Ghiorsea sp.]
MKHFLLLLSFCILPFLAQADDDGFGFFSSKGGVEAVKNDLYRANCAECHFAYQPGLLPKRSWQALMMPKALENHFGDNAELDEPERQKILTYLTNHAADDSGYKRSRKMMRSIAENETPLRITEVSYFKRKHDEIPLRYVTGNPKVKSWANCAACHTTAEKGSFDDDDVRIPGVGRWED